MPAFVIDVMIKTNKSCPEVKLNKFIALSNEVDFLDELMAREMNKLQPPFGLKVTNMFSFSSAEKNLSKAHNLCCD